MKKINLILAFVLLSGLLSLNSCKQRANKNTETFPVVTDEQITEAYAYLLGRALVVRQEQMDFNDTGLEYNTINYNEFGNANWVNPNMDCAYNEAWIAIDENSATILEIPEIKGRYYVAQLMDGWGEVITNIQEREYPDHPYGKFALVLKGSTVKIPEGALKIEMPCKKIKMLARIEVQNTIEEGIKLQKEFKMSVIGNPKIDPIIDFPDFQNNELPGHVIFSYADKFLESSPDTYSPNADSIQSILKQVKEYTVKSEANAAQVDSVIANKSIPEFMNFAINKAGVVKNNWLATLKVGNYFGDYWTRTAADFVGLWANNVSEVIYFIASKDINGQTLGGGKSYQFKFTADNLPEKNEDGFWSVILVDFPGYRVVSNDLNRYNFNNFSKLHYEADGSLIFYVAPEYNPAWPKSNWLPSPKEGAFNLTFRMYIPKQNVVDGEWFPGALTEI